MASDSTNNITFSRTFKPVCGTKCSTAFISEEPVDLTIRVYSSITNNEEPFVPETFRRSDEQFAPGAITAMFEVSAKVMLESSNYFNSMYTDNGCQETDEVYADFEFYDGNAVKIFLRALHNTLRPSDFSCSYSTAVNVKELAQIFDIRQDILNYWFSVWLSNKDLLHISGSALPSLLTLCTQYNHTFGISLIEGLIAEEQYAQKSLTYTPILAKSFRQNSAEVFLGRIINPSEYESTGFSDRFMYEYGEPMEYFSDFYRLMTMSPRTHLVPRYKSWGNLCQTRFVGFAKAVDDKVNYLSTKNTEHPVWRDEMEAIWVQLAMKMFEDEVLRLGNDFSNLDTRGRLHAMLKKILNKRFKPSAQIEKYWRYKVVAYDSFQADIQKKNGVNEPAVMMDFARPEHGEMDLEVDIDALGSLMNSLQVESETDDGNDYLTAQEAMIKAMAQLRT